VKRDISCRLVLFSRVLWTLTRLSGARRGTNIIGWMNNATWQQAWFALARIEKKISAIARSASLGGAVKRRGCAEKTEKYGAKWRLASEKLKTSARIMSPAKMTAQRGGSAKALSSNGRQNGVWSDSQRADMAWQAANGRFPALSWLDAVKMKHCGCGNMSCAFLTALPQHADIICGTALSACVSSAMLPPQRMAAYASRSDNARLPARRLLHAGYISSLMAAFTPAPHIQRGGRLSGGDRRLTAPRYRVAGRNVRQGA